MSVELTTHVLYGIKIDKALHPKIESDDFQESELGNDLLYLWKDDWAIVSQEIYNDETRSYDENYYLGKIVASIVEYDNFHHMSKPYLATMEDDRTLLDLYTEIFGRRSSIVTFLTSKSIGVWVIPVYE